MGPHKRGVTWWVVASTVVALVVAACGPSARPAAPAAEGAAPGGGQGAPARGAPAAAVSDAFQDALRLPLDELHQKALGEGGTLVYYGTLAQINAEKILPAFEARFPGIKVEHVDATSDRLAARIIAEARGGKVLGDVYEAQLTDAVNLNKSGLLLHAMPPEADAYPDGFKVPYSIAIGMTYLVAAWNTNLVRPEEAPRTLEDLADPRWKGRLIAEPRDVEFMIGLIHKYGSEEKAFDLMRRFAANEPEFHKGHSELAELLVAGQAAACLTCYSHHFPTRIRRGAPVDYLLLEGVGQSTASAVLKGAPHPYTAMLWQRYMHSEEGQQIYADGGRTPAHPNVPPRDKTRPDTTYVVTAEDVEQMARYERVWKEIFDLR